MRLSLELAGWVGRGAVSARRVAWRQLQVSQVPERGRSHDKSDETDCESLRKERPPRVRPGSQSVASTDVRTTVTHDDVSATADRLWSETR